MPEFPKRGGVIGGNITTGNGADITSSGSANTKGSYTEVIASTPYATRYLHIEVGVAFGNSDVTMIDIATGAAASEVIIINNLYVGRLIDKQVAQVLIPLFIPAGTRLSARCQSTGTSKAVNVRVHCIDGGMYTPQPLAQVITYAANTADTSGAQVDPGAAVNTKGSWVELSSSCSAVKALFLAVGQTAAFAAGTETITARLDIGIGAAGSELVLIPDLLFGAGADSSTSPNLTAAYSPQFSAVIPCTIPAGTRIAVRASSTSVQATNRLIDVVAYGIN